MFDSITVMMVWFLLGLAFLIAELINPTFVLLFFGIGCWMSTLFIFIGLAPYLSIQVAIFSITTLLTLWLFRAKGKGLARGKVSGINPKSESHPESDGLGLVIEDINPHSLCGKVELHGTNWKATSDLPIKKGTAVKIISRDNLTLKVKPIKD